MKQHSYNKQKGVVLLWALAILLVLTILSISSLKVSNVNTKLAGNSMSSMLVYQGAESTLSKTANLFYINEAANNMPDRSKAVPEPDLPSETVSGGSLVSTASLAFIGEGPCPAFNNVAMSSTVITCHIYQVDAESRLKGTGARGMHSLGIAKPVPH